MSGTCLLLVPSPASYMANCPSSGCSSLWTSWELSLAILMLSSMVCQERARSRKTEVVPTRRRFLTSSICICDHESTERDTRKAASAQPGSLFLLPHHFTELASGVLGASEGLHSRGL